MKKFATITVVALMLALCLCLAACDEDEGRILIVPAYPEIPKPATPGATGSSSLVSGDVSGAHKAYAVTAVGTGVLLGGLTESAPSSAAASGPATAEELGEDAMAAINKYLGIAENLLSDGGVTAEDTDSDRDGYSKKMTAESTDLQGVKSSFVLYYNEGAPTEDDGETEIRLDGIMLYNGAEYAVEGKRESERDESELEFTAYLDRSNYVKIQREVEDGEEEFAYIVVKNGVMVSMFEVEVEREAQKTEVEVKSYSGGQTMTVDFEKKTDAVGGKSYIEAKCVENNILTTFQIYVTAGENGEETYLYKFSTGREVNMSRDWDD